jgi:hypothetical protein
MILPLLLAASVLAVDAPAASNEFAHWSAAEIEAQGRSLAEKMKDGAVNGTLHNFGNHTARLTCRDTDGKPELHENKNDFFVVEA